MHHFYKTTVLFILISSLLTSMHSSANGDVGKDLMSVFSRAHQGEALRAVAIGGSITQAGKGWIGPWLQEQFPASIVTMRNAGMSATGSTLGIFRLKRDVISVQPDLVLIEFAVNDSSASDDTVIHNLESIVVRLKTLPNPPAIVFVETAAINGSNRVRHEKVASHYNLFNIDLQDAVDAKLKAESQTWETLFSDDVHPHSAGHDFYTDVIGKALMPFVTKAKASTKQSVDEQPLPEPLTKQPLLLDGELVPLPVAKGWNPAHSVPFWWTQFFNGFLQTKELGASLTLTAKGTTIGLLYPLEKDGYGSFYASLDGGKPVLIDQATRGGYTYTILGKDLAPCVHTIQIVTANPIGREPAPVYLGYVLAAGGTQSSTKMAPQQNTDLATLTALALRTFRSYPAKMWEWCGPYGGSEKTTGPTSDLEMVFEPETDSKSVNWQQLTGEGEMVDFAALTGWSDRGVCYAKTTIESEQARESLLGLKIDYFGKVWVNGELAQVIDQSHGSPKTSIIIPIQLKKGKNTILLKVHSGSQGNNFSASLLNPGS